MEPSQTVRAILAANRDYLDHKPCRADVKVNCLLVACMSPKINRHLPAALGLEPEQCYIARNPGGTVTAHDNSVLRAAVLSAAIGASRLIVVLGHEQCSAASDAGELMDRFERAGVKRSSLDSDLRGWLGLIGSAEANVRSTVDALAALASLPEGIEIAGMMMNSSGALQPICQASTHRAPLEASGKRSSGSTGTVQIGSTIAAPPVVRQAEEIPLVGAEDEAPPVAASVAQPKPPPLPAQPKVAGNAGVAPKAPPVQAVSPSQPAAPKRPGRPQIESLSDAVRALAGGKSRAVRDVFQAVNEMARLRNKRNKQ